MDIVFERYRDSHGGLWDAPCASYIKESNREGSKTESFIAKPHANCTARLLKLLNLACTSTPFVAGYELEHLAIASCNVAGKQTSHTAADDVTLFSAFAKEALRAIQFADSTLNSPIDVDSPLRSREWHEAVTKVMDVVHKNRWP